MTKDIVDPPTVPILGSDWFDPLESGVRQQLRSLIEGLLEEELAAVLKRARYERGAEASGYRNGHRDRQVLGTFGAVTVSVPRARVTGPDGKPGEWRSQGLPAYQRLTRRAEALIAGTYLAGTNTRRVRRALGTLFEGAVGKDTVSRVWHKVQADWQAWQKRSLADDDIVRVILDGTAVRVRVDRKATSLSVLVALGVRRDGQKVLLALRNMGGESEAAWRALLDEMIGRGLVTPELLIVDGAPGLEKALAAVWPQALVQRCTVHTIRTQSTIRVRGGITSRGRAVQRDDMADLKAVIMDDDALDNELQDGLLIGEGGLVQPSANALAERRQVRQHLLCLGTLVA